MNIEIISWGSLVSDPRTLKVFGWNNDGPVIPIEFTRVSRDGRLTPVINENVGGLVQTYHAHSRFNNLRQAIDNFIERENIEENRIGIIEPSINRISECCRRHNSTTQIILNWGRQTEYDAILYCALGTRFKDVLDLDYTVENALSYLEELDQTTKLNAIRYLLNIPEQTLTPFMREFRNRFNISFEQNEV